MTLPNRDYSKMGKDYLPSLIEGAPTEAGRRVLEIRQLAGKSATAKYAKALHTQVDGRVRGALQFYGARTGRWSGRLFQPQNMVRPTIDNLGPAIASVKAGTADLLYDDPIEVASSCARSAIAASLNHKLVVADLANIEGRMLAWLAGEEWKLDAFRDFDAGIGPDIYKLAYAKAFHLDVEKVTSAQRSIGKVMELALGYQGAVGAFNQMASAYGVELEEDAVLTIVKAWRKAHPEVVRMWYGTQDVAVKAVRNPDTVFECKGVRWMYTRRHQDLPWLYCKLPSERSLCYFDPHVKTTWNERRKREDYSVTYRGISSVTRQWTHIDTYGGMLVENITQATARDLLAEGMYRAEAARYRPVLTVHDEVVCETPDDSRYSSEELSSMLSTNPDWCKDLPLAAEGYESPFFKKG